MTNIKDSYILQYKKYIQDPISNIEIMSKMIFDYSHIASRWTEDLYFECMKSNLHKKTKTFFDYDLLKTNGSTGTQSNEYKWGPNFHLLVNSIWDHSHRRIYKFDTRYWINTNYYKNKILSNKKQNEGIVININPSKKIDLILKKSCFIINPVKLSMLLKSSHFIDFIKKNAAVISITEVDGSFYDFSLLRQIGIPLINQMRSWKEGTAFYTCPYNIRHWMENLFYCTKKQQVFDLFNFHNNWWDLKGGNPDNIWTLEKKFKLCKCGAWYRKINFQPHAINRFYTYLGSLSDYRRLSENNFKKKYEYFQIIQKSDLSTFEVHVPDYLNNNDFNKTKEFIEKVYKNTNYNITIVNSKYKIGINKKTPVFWSEYHPTNSENLFNIL